MKAKDFIKAGNLLIEQGKMLIAYGEHLTNIRGEKPKSKVLIPEQRLIWIT